MYNKYKKNKKLGSLDVMLSDEYFNIKKEVETLKNDLFAGQNKYYIELITCHLIYFLTYELHFGSLLIVDLLELDVTKIRTIQNRFKSEKIGIFSTISKNLLTPLLSNEFIMLYENFTAKYINKCNKKVFKL